MRNSYPVTCYRCGKKVETGQGHFEVIPLKERNGAKWRLQHAGCAILYRGTKEGKKSS